MTLFELVAKITADSTEFDSAVGKAEKSGKSLKDSLSANMGKIKTAIVGALSVAAIKKGIDKVIDLANAVSVAGDRIDKQSQVLGLSRKAYQEWDYILGQNGASIDSMNVSMKTLNSTILSAKDGNKEAKDSFAQLGVGIHELENLSVEDQFEAVVRAFQRMPAGANKSALAVKLFGRQGMELLPLLNQSETSIDELRKRAEELGLIMSDEAVDASVVYGDSLDDLNRTMNGLRYSIGAKFLPILTTGIQKLTNFVGRLSKAFQKGGIKGVIDALSESAGNLVEKLKNSDNPVLQIVGKSLEAVKNVFDWIIEHQDLVIGAVGGIIAAFAVTKIVTFVTSLNPLTVVFTLIAGAIGLVAANWDKIKDWIGKAWDTTVSFVSQGWEDIKGAFDTVSSWVGEKVNNIKLAFTATVASWITKIDEWLKGTGIKDIVLGFGATLATWIKTIGGWLDGTKATEFTLSIGATVSEWIQRIWDWVTNGVDIVVNFLGNMFGGNPGNSEYDGWEQEQGKGGPPGSHTWEVPAHNAKGLWSVPTDDYLTRLHRGEMVLNASRARDYRQGSQGIDMTQLVSGVVGAIRQGMDGAEVNSYLDGKGVSGNVNRRTLNQIKARRFAT